MSTKKFLSMFLLLLCVFSIFFAESIELQILATSDLHGRFLPYDYALNQPDYSGSLAQVATIIRELKSENPSNTILIDNGDTIQENLSHIFLDDAIHPMIFALNEMNYDVFVLGNHEFNYGIPTLKKVMRQFVPKDEDPNSVLCGNVYNPDGTRLAAPYKIVTTEDGIKVGIIGMVTPNITRWDAANLKDYIVVDPVDEARIGISTYPQNSKDPEQLINQARTALNVSSKSDINFYSLDLSNLIKYENLIEEEIYYALQNNKLVLFFQPQIDTDNFEIIGAEALIRMQKSDGTILSPFDFLEVAKKKGLMTEIDRFVLESTAKIAKELNSSLNNKIKVFFNVSKSFFEDKDFLNFIEIVLDKYDIDPSYLGVELTEEIFIDDFYSAQKKINALKNMGLQIALDDFGTGFSSLAYLNKLRIDKIKIDKSFIDDLLKSESSKRLVSSIISMSHILGLEVIAEGVETQEQLSFLQSKGCYEIQGYYFSKPLPLAEFVKSFC
jgi:EAL domain-containing protein (putative c-di-GMP-specific phosphodiesterase class I)